MQERRSVAALTRCGLLAFAIAVVVVVVDRVTTTLAVDHLHDVRHVWGPFGFALTYNSGFAFSLFSGRGALVTILLCVGVVVLAFVVAQVRTWPLAVGTGLVLGGAAGNLSERIVGNVGGQVPDFITLRDWPTFNVADACVTVGVIMVVVSLLFGGHEGEGRSDGDPTLAPTRTEAQTEGPV